MNLDAAKDAAAGATGKAVTCDVHNQMVGMKV